VVVEESQAFAVASGGAAHIYINLKGREKDGFVPPEDYAQIQTQIVDLFSALTDPKSGEAVFQRVLPREQLAALHFDHPNAGMCLFRLCQAIT
jgi:predicted AlkP superfamily phosphohydrolase/phosphomutase